MRHCAPTDCGPGTMVADFLRYWDEDAVAFNNPSASVVATTCCVTGPAFSNRMVGRDQRAVVHELSEDHWFAFLGHCAEWAFQWSDYLTRTSGRLTKCVGFVDAAGLTFASCHPECFRRDIRALGNVKVFYPQTLEAIKMSKSPATIRFLWRMAKALFPNSVFSNVDSCHEIHEQNHHQAENFFPDFDFSDRF